MLIKLLCQFDSQKHLYYDFYDFLTAPELRANKFKRWKSYHHIVSSWLAPVIINTFVIWNVVLHCTSVGNVRTLTSLHLNPGILLKVSATSLARLLNDSSTLVFSLSHSSCDGSPGAGGFACANSELVKPSFINKLLFQISIRDSRLQWPKRLLLLCIRFVSPAKTPRQPCLDVGQTQRQRIGDNAQD